MNVPKKVTIIYFSDMLCIWAYLAQIRIDEVKIQFGNRVELEYHFIQVFGSVESKMEQNWNHRGGVPAYSEHVQEIASRFDHIDVHPEIWNNNTPTTSGSCHLFLKAIQILEAQKELSSISKPEDNHKSVFEAIVWELRLAFFRDLIDISKFHAQMEIAERLVLPLQKIQDQIESGAAFAALDRDLQIRKKHRVTGSPTLIFNEGRQILYGNVGYRVMEANIEELFKQTESQASWC
ncbi:MAG: disulfide bond formation protein DsbA [Deltaproteobacteria bacterium]|nr:disulfide bond formation protein DsbA [Deltaproteobacteria bacterium]